MAKLVLSDHEIGLVKGLILHRSLNDQQVLAIFSYLERNFNHRVIADIRKGDKERYTEVSPASESEISKLLQSYSKIEALAEALVFYPTNEIEGQIRKAVEIFKTAILVYNNNLLLTRSETFIVLANIAWTYVLHAHFRRKDVEPVYKDAGGFAVQIDGQDKLWELSHCIQKEKADLTTGEKLNLKYLIAIRNAIEHRSSEDVNDAIQGKIQANALNFLHFVKRNFGPKYDFSLDLAFAIQLQALTLGSANAITGSAPVSKSVAAVNALMEETMTQAEFDDPAYSFRVYVVPKVTNNVKNADQAVTFSPVGSDVEMAIKHVERPKYRMKETLKRLKEHDDVSITSHQFITIWKKHKLKLPGKGLAIELGSQWFWYQEGIDKIKEIFESN